MKSKKEKKEIVIEKYSVKERLLIAGLTGLAVSFMFFLFGTIDIYANNMAEFAFTFSDIIGPVLITFFVFWIVISAVVFVFNKAVLNIFTAGIFGMIIASYIDNFISGRALITSGDVNGMSQGEYIQMVSVYMIICVSIAVISIALKNKWKNAVVFLSVLIIGMNGASLISDIATKNLLSDNDINCDYVLSTKGIDTVSEQENIIYILFDRFDTNYYKAVVEKYPDYFDDLEGFTLYDSATSVYTRTYPSVPYMISGVPYKAEVSPVDYFDKAYGESQFLKDLKANGYQINVFADRYYEYADAKSFLGIADNVEEVTSYSTNDMEIVKYLSKLSLARSFRQYLSMAMYSNANEGVSATLSTLECESGVYQDNDAKYYKFIQENHLQSDESEKTYTFIYLHGSHQPFILDENCEVSENASGVSQTVGSFKIVKEYLNQLKELGVYDNSTIIIAGDHGYPRQEILDFIEQEQFKDWGLTTCIFFKPKNADNKTLITSSAEVSSANIIPAIVQDANLQTDYNYGKSLIDIKEGENNPRTFYHSYYIVNEHHLCFNVYEINGNAHDVNNWKKVDFIESEYQWY